MSYALRISLFSTGLAECQRPKTGLLNFYYVEQENRGGVQNYQGRRQFGGVDRSEKCKLRLNGRDPYVNRSFDAAIEIQFPLFVETTLFGIYRTQLRKNC